MEAVVKITMLKVCCLCLPILSNTSLHLARLIEIFCSKLQCDVLFSQLDSKVIEGIAMGDAKYADSSLLKVSIFIAVQIPLCI